MSDIAEIDALVKSRMRSLRQVEIAEVAGVAGDGLSARVYRQGQTTATKFLTLASGLTVNVGDRVQVMRVNGNLNTAYIAAVVA